MIRARFAQTGPPAQVLELEELVTPDPGPAEVRLRWLAAPINPADLNFVEGTYGDAPTLPDTPGMEGVAQVEALGQGVTELTEGDTVIARRRLGSWASHGLAKPADLWRIPADLLEHAPMTQWAQLRINPLTAQHLLAGFADLQGGDVVLVNAANSAVGQCLVQLSSLRAVTVAAFARREEALAPLKKLNREALTYVDGEEGYTTAKEELTGRRVSLACNCVGGDSALHQLKLLSPQGVQVTYGAMAREAGRLPAGLMIFKELRLEGLWITRWQARAPREQVDDCLRQLAESMAEGSLRLPLDSTFPLMNLPQALARASESKRGGKVVLEMS